MYYDFYSGRVVPQTLCDTADYVVVSVRRVPPPRWANTMFTWPGVFQPVDAPLALDINACCHGMCVLRCRAAVLPSSCLEACLRKKLVCAKIKVNGAGVCMADPAGHSVP